MVFKLLHKKVQEAESMQKIKIELGNEQIRKLLKHGFYSGLGWAAGVTIGFAMVSTIVVLLLNSLGGLPFVGGFFADIVEATTSQLSGRTPVSSTHKATSTPTATPTNTPTPYVEPFLTNTPTPTILLTPTPTVIE